MRMLYALAVAAMFAGASLPAVAQTARQTTTTQTSNETTVQPRQGHWWQGANRAASDASGFAQPGAAIAYSGR